MTDLLFDVQDVSSCADGHPLRRRLESLQRRGGRMMPSEEGGKGGGGRGGGAGGGRGDRRKNVLDDEFPPARVDHNAIRTGLINVEQIILRFACKSRG